MVTGPEIERAFDRLGLTGSRAVIHASLKSFGRVDGGAVTVAAAIAKSFDTALMPAFSFVSSTPPPASDRPHQNGYDYGAYDGQPDCAVPFRLETAPIDPSMGAVARAFADLREVTRSDHAWHSWAGRGPAAASLLQPHPWDTTNLPLDRLAAEDSFVVLIGVGLRSCTAVHVAEEWAGRRPFIRWAIDREGVVRRVRAAGCSKGFDALDQFASDLFTETRAGDSRVRAAPLRALIERCAQVILDRPHLTRCTSTCLRCGDSMRGGPLES